jgi:hypothetical protein
VVEYNNLCKFIILQQNKEAYPFATIQSPTVFWQQVAYSNAKQRIKSGKEKENHQHFPKTW